MKRIITVFTLLIAMVASTSAYAACSTPTAGAGTMFYNTGQNALQFCNGTDWYNTGLVVPTATGTTCTTPTGPEGSAFYNTTQNTVQFCNGDNWVNMGTMRFPSATGTSCTAPAGEEGTMFFNTTTSTMQFCNGDDWVNATHLTVAAAAFSEVGKIVASDRQANDYFGTSVSISGDYAIVGAHGEDAAGTDAGAAYIYKRTGTSWAQEAKITAPDAEASDTFGGRVAINGDYVLIGAAGEDAGASNAGAVYVFKRTGTSWAQEAKLLASDAQANDQFGLSVAIDGVYATVGAPGEDTGATNAGAVYVFKRTGTTWAQEAKIQASDAQSSDQFGTAAINGDYIIVGASHEDTGATNAGAAYIFKRSGTSWTQEAKIQASDAQSEDFFGRSVSIHNDYVVVGAHQESTGATYAGAAYIFKRSGTSWTQEAKIQSSDLDSSRFGSSASIENDYVIVGAPLHNGSRGAAYIFKRTGTSWSEEIKIQASDISGGDQFAISVAMNNGRMIVGSYGKLSYTGAAYIFD